MTTTTEATPDPVSYTARATSTGGRAGRSVTDDGALDVALAAPKELGGSGDGTNPEQLFAAGYSACFQGALGVTARKRGVDTATSLVTAEVGIGKHGGAFALAVTLRVVIPGVELDVVQELAEEAHEVCPYSRAIRGNVPVSITAVAA